MAILISRRHERWNFENKQTENAQKIVVEGEIEGAGWYVIIYFLPLNIYVHLCTSHVNLVCLFACERNSGDRIP